MVPTSFRFLYYMSISLLLSTRLNYAMYDQQELQQYMTATQWSDFKSLTVKLPLPDYLVQAIKASSNQLKFELARIILAKSNKTIREELRSCLKTIIAQSYQPLELYKNKILKLDRWGQWLNVQRNSQGNYYQTPDNDIHRLFECYDLPESLGYYNLFNKELYNFQVLDPVRRYARSGTESMDFDVLITNLQQLEYNLHEVLVKELREKYGVILTAEHVKAPFDCTFNATLSLDAQAEEKLQDSIEQQLGSRE